MLRTSSLMSPSSTFRLAPEAGMKAVTPATVMSPRSMKAATPSTLMSPRSTATLVPTSPTVHRAPETGTQSWAQQMSDLKSSFSKEIATLAKRMETMEESLKTFVTEKQLEVIAAEEVNLMNYYSREVTTLKERMEMIEDNAKAFVTEKHLEVKATQSELMSDFSRVVTTLTERLDTMEEHTEAFVTAIHLDVKAAENREHVRRLGSEMENLISEAVEHEASLRQQLSDSFSEALGMESDNRANDISELQRALHEVLSLSAISRTPGASDAGSQQNSEVPPIKNCTSEASDAFEDKWKAVASGFSELRSQLAEEALRKQTKAKEAQNLLSACAAALKADPVNASQQNAPDVSPQTLPEVSRPASSLVPLGGTGGT